MKITRREFLSTAGLAAASIPFVRSASSSDDQLLLWYDEPAGQWTDGLPIGNGRLGAMVFGDPEFELLQLNEDTLYAGRPYDPNNPEALKALPEVRRLIFAGRYREAHELVGACVFLASAQASSFVTGTDIRVDGGFLSQTI